MGVFEKHNAYWYIVEIEDKIVEPGRRNFPEYFDVVDVNEVRDLLFRKFREGLVSAAVRVRRAAVIAQTPVRDDRRQQVVSILRRLTEEVNYSFQEARQDYVEMFPNVDQEPPPSPRAVLTQVRKMMTFWVR